MQAVVEQKRSVLVTADAPHPHTSIALTTTTVTTAVSAAERRPAVPLNTSILERWRAVERPDGDNKVPSPEEAIVFCRFMQTYLASLCEHPEQLDKEWCAKQNAKYATSRIDGAGNHPLYQTQYALCQLAQGALTDLVGVQAGKVFSWQHVTREHVLRGVQACQQIQRYCLSTLPSWLSVFDDRHRASHADPAWSSMYLETLGTLLRAVTQASFAHLQEKTMQHPLSKQQCKQLALVYWQAIVQWARYRGQRAHLLESTNVTKSAFGIAAVDFARVQEALQQWARPMYHWLGHLAYEDEQNLSRALVCFRLAETSKGARRGGSDRGVTWTPNSWASRRTRNGQPSALAMKKAQIEQRLANIDVHVPLDASLPVDASSSSFAQSELDVTSLEF